MWFKFIEQIILLQLGVTDLLKPIKNYTISSLTNLKKIYIQNGVILLWFQPNQDQWVNLFLYRSLLKVIMTWQNKFYKFNKTGNVNLPVRCLNNSWSLVRVTLRQLGHTHSYRKFKRQLMTTWCKFRLRSNFSSEILNLNHFCQVCIFGKLIIFHSIPFSSKFQSAVGWFLLFSMSCT